MANDSKGPERPTSFGIPGLEPSELGKTGLEAMTKMQQEFVGNLEKMSRGWLAQTQATAALFGELMQQLWKSRSAPETMAAYQNFLNRRMEMMVEESRQFFANSEKFMKAGTKILSNGLAASDKPEGDKGGKR